MVSLPNLLLCGRAFSCSRTTFSDSFTGLVFQKAWYTTLWTKLLYYCVLTVTPRGRKSTWITHSESHNPLAMILTAVSWKFWVVEIPCHVIPCWIGLTLEWSSAPKSHHRSLFILNVFPSNWNWCRCSADTETQRAFWSNIHTLGIHCAHSSLNIFMDNEFTTSNTSTVGCNIMHCNSPHFPKSGLWRDECSSRVHMLAEHLDVVRLRLPKAFGKITVWITDTHDRVSPPYCSLTYEEFLLASLSPSSGI
jgi:hypothetical protein